MAGGLASPADVRRLARVIQGLRNCECVMSEAIPRTMLEEDLCGRLVW